MTDEAFAHGYLGYAKGGCRCKVCTDAKAAYMREYRQRARLVDQEFFHGVAGYTDRGCRCEVCVTERRRSNRRRADA